jgi:hypothetical protein
MSGAISIEKINQCGKTIVPFAMETISTHNGKFTRDLMEKYGRDPEHGERAGRQCPGVREVARERRFSLSCHYS